MFKSVLIAVSTVAAVTLPVATEANAFGLASAARTIAPKAVTVEARQSDIACATAADGCHRGRTFFLTYEMRVRNLLYVQAGSGEAVVDSLRRDMIGGLASGSLFASLSGSKASTRRFG